MILIIIYDRFIGRKLMKNIWVVLRVLVSSQIKFDEIQYKFFRRKKPGWKH